MNEKEIIDLLTRYNEDKCTPKQKRLVEAWYNSIPAKNELSASVLESYKNKIWIEIKSSQRKTTYLRFLPYAAILAVTLCVSLLVYLLANKELGKENLQAQLIEPGSNKAILFLGQKDSIDLKTLQSGQQVNLAGALIKKLADGTISYQLTANPRAAVVHNKLIVPRGGVFKIMLSDSSTVTLNSQSTLEFPSKFTKGERKVSMIGEGYFEVAKDSQKPFIVQTKGQTVEVLGTKFNIKSYHSDDNVITTLVEGKVRVGSPKTQPAILLPGNQAIFDGSTINVLPAKVQAITSWKSDYFVFEMESLENIMQNISHWYNVEVNFENQQIKHFTFTGSFPKKQNIHDVLELLKQTNKVNFTIENRTIIVKSK